MFWKAFKHAEHIKMLNIWQLAIKENGWLTVQKLEDPGIPTDCLKRIQSFRISSVSSARIFGKMWPGLLDLDMVPSASSLFINLKHSAERYDIFQQDYGEWWSSWWWSQKGTLQIVLKSGKDTGISEWD